MFPAIFRRFKKNIKNKNQSLRNMRRLENITKRVLRCNELQSIAINSTQKMIDSSNHNNNLVVSLTTHSKRIHDVHLAIESIAQQSIKPSRIILWLDENEFSTNMLPSILLRQNKRGLEIKYCRNLKSYTKIIPTLLECPTSNIITIDDDIIYPYDMLEILLKDSQNYPGIIIGHRAHEITLTKKGTLQKYNNWNKNTSNCSPSHNIFLTGVGGVLYPSGCFNREVFNEEVFMDICRLADDVWLKAMAMINNTLCKKVDDSRSLSNRLFVLPEHQDIGLNTMNVAKDLNDEQLERVVNKYQLLTTWNNAYSISTAYAHCQ